MTMGAEDLGQYLQYLQLMTEPPLPGPRPAIHFPSWPLNLSQTHLESCAPRPAPWWRPHLVTYSSQRGPHVSVSFSHLSRTSRKISYVSAFAQKRSKSQPVSFLSAFSPHVSSPATRDRMLKLTRDKHENT